MARVVHNIEDIKGQTIAAGIFCVDSRFLGNQPLAELLLMELGLERIYAHRIAGPDRRLSEGHPICVEGAKFQAQEITDLTGTNVLLVGSHGNCARHDVSDEQHRKDTLAAAHRMAGELDDGWLVLPLFFRLIGH